MEGFFQWGEVKKAAPVGLSPKCGSCGLYRKCNTPKMEPWGEGKLKVLIVGDQPGDTEDELGRPFTGKPGQLLQESIRAIGRSFKRDSLMTNAIICRPPEDRMPQNGKEILWCKPNLTKVIREFKPRVVIALGRSAMKSMLEGIWEEIGELNRWTGYQIPMNGFWLCPTWHPSDVLKERNRVMEKMFTDQLDAAFSLKEAPAAQPNLEKIVTKLYEEREIVKAIEEIEGAGITSAFDYETNCLKPEYPKARIHSASISNGKLTIAYPWIGKAVKATSRFLQSKKVKKVAANMKFEQRWTMKMLGHPIEALDLDTMLATHAMDNRPGICSLKFQLFVQFGIAPYDTHVKPFLEAVEGSHYNRIHEVDMGTILQYNGIDSWGEKKLARKQLKQLGYVTDK